MNNIQMTFDELLTMKALQFKSDISGRGNGSLINRLLESDEAQAETIGMKNMCFRVHPVLQARFEVTLQALGMSKQEALTEALEELLNRFDEKLSTVGLGAISYDKRLKELGYTLGPPDEHGGRKVIRLTTKEA